MSIIYGIRCAAVQPSIELKGGLGGGGWFAIICIRVYPQRCSAKDSDCDAVRYDVLCGGRSSVRPNTHIYIYWSLDQIMRFVYSNCDYCTYGECWWFDCEFMFRYVWCLSHTWCSTDSNVRLWDQKEWRRTQRTRSSPSLSVVRHCRQIIITGGASSEWVVVVCVCAQKHRMSWTDSLCPDRYAPDCIYMVDADAHQLTGPPTANQWDAVTKGRDMVDVAWNQNGWVRRRWEETELCTISNRA